MVGGSFISWEQGACRREALTFPHKLGEGGVIFGDHISDRALIKVLGKEGPEFIKPAREFLKDLHLKGAENLQFHIF